MNIMNNSNRSISKCEGDNTHIDWGYAYWATNTLNDGCLAAGNYYIIKENFAKTGKLLPQRINVFTDNLIQMTVANTSETTNQPSSYPVLTYAKDLGTAEKSNRYTGVGFFMIDCSCILLIEYFHKQLHAYWKHNRKADIFTAFERAWRYHFVNTVSSWHFLYALAYLQAIAHKPFRKFISPVYRYADETQSRVPISDFYDTDSSKMENFKARPVVGGFYIKMFCEKMKNKATE
jgi:hypothetical protein